MQLLADNLDEGNIWRPVFILRVEAKAFGQFLVFGVAFVSSCWQNKVLHKLLM